MEKIFMSCIFRNSIGIAVLLFAILFVASCSQVASGDYTDGYDYDDVEYPYRDMGWEFPDYTETFELDATLVIAGKFMGTRDDVSTKKLAEKILDRLNLGLNPGGITVRSMQVLYAKNHPVVGSLFPDDEPVVLKYPYNEGESVKTPWVDSLGHWPGHERKIHFVLGHYIEGRDKYTAGFSPYEGIVFTEEGQTYYNHISLATYTNKGTSSMSAQEVADVAIHELGHFFGLMHTSELDGSAFDDIEDTPECAELKKSDYPMERCPDYGYIMFPFSTASGKAQATFSLEQMEIIRSYLSQQKLYRVWGD
jgi:hypothetical protein